MGINEDVLTKVRHPIAYQGFMRRQLKYLLMPRIEDVENQKAMMAIMRGEIPVHCLAPDVSKLVDEKDKLVSKTAQISLFCMMGVTGEVHYAVMNARNSMVSHTEENFY